MTDWSMVMSTTRKKYIVYQAYDLKTAGGRGRWEDQARFDRKLALRLLKYVG